MKVIEVPWPKTVVYKWRCRMCNTVHTSEFYEAEPGDGNYDSFDFHCQCGAYFKKASRIPDADIIEITEVKE